MPAGVARHRRSCGGVFSSHRFCRSSSEGLLAGNLGGRQHLFAFPSCDVGLDEDEDIFQKYGIPYQPVTILIASDQTVVADWAGLKSEEELRDILEMLIDIST